MVDFLSNLPKIIEKKKKRIGRGIGSGRGSKSGRGTTRHQKARESIPLHFEGGQGRMVKKYPLLRGKGRNKPRRPSLFPIRIGKLNTVFKDGETVDVEALIKKGIVDSRYKVIGVKVLGGGKLEKKLIVKLPVSQEVKKLIEKTGGKVE